MKILSNLYVLVAIVVVTFSGTLAYLWKSAATEAPLLPETMHTKTVDGAAIAALWNTQTGHVEKVVDELKQQLSKIDTEKSALEQMKERITAEKLELKRIQTDIATQQRALDDMITRIEASEVKNLRAQATVYSNMEPASTLQVFKTLNDTEVIKILYFMAPDVQSAIFTEFIQDPDAKSTDPKKKEDTTAKVTGPERVARLNELLKFTQPPEKPKS